MPLVVADYFVRAVGAPYFLPFKENFFCIFVSSYK